MPAFVIVLILSVVRACFAPSFVLCIVILSSVRIDASIVSRIISSLVISITVASHPGVRVAKV